MEARRFLCCDPSSEACAREGFLEVLVEPRVEDWVGDGGHQTKDEARKEKMNGFLLICLGKNCHQEGRAKGLMLTKKVGSSITRGWNRKLLLVRSLLGLAFERFSTAFLHVLRLC